MIKSFTKNLMEGTKIITLTDDIFTEDSVIEVYPDSTSNVIPEGVSVSGHTCIVSFDEDTPETIPIKIIVNNTDGLLDASEISYITDLTVNQSDFNELTQSNFDRVDGLVSEMQDDISNVESDINTINDDLSSLDTRVTSSEANIGDLYELETSNKDNLVDALNEINGRSSGGFNISTVETKTGKKINNKDVYIKLYPYTGGIASAGTNIGSSVIDNLSVIEFIVNAYFFRTNNTKTFSPVATYVSGNNLSIRTMYNADATPYGCLVFEYTKVGDV